MRVRTALLIALLFLLLVAPAASAPHGMLAPRQPVFFLLAASGMHYPKLTAALGVVGYVAREGSFAAYLSSRGREPFILVVPHAESRRLTARILPYCVMLSGRVNRCCWKAPRYLPQNWG